MIQEEERKRVERELHDHLRGTLGDDPAHLSNKKFYSIDYSSREYVRTWLAERVRGKRVLDYCCGNGAWAIWLAESGAEVVGIDISPVSVDNARAEAARRGVGEKATFSVMDAEATKFEDNFFDFAVVNGVLHHLDLQKSYRELARILKPDGQVIATEALKHNPLFHLYRKLTPHLRSEWEVAHILGKHDIGAAKTFYQDVKVARFFHLATLGAVPFRNTPVFGPLRRGLEAVDAALLSLPVLKWQAWMAVFILSHPRKAPTVYS